MRKCIPVVFFMLSQYAMSACDKALYGFNGSFNGTRVFSTLDAAVPDACANATASECNSGDWLSCSMVSCERSTTVTPNTTYSSKSMGSDSIDIDNKPSFFWALLF
jgi:hypothetical protein